MLPHWEDFQLLFILFRKATHAYVLDCRNNTDCLINLPLSRDLWTCYCHWPLHLSLTFSNRSSHRNEFTCSIRCWQYSKKNSWKIEFCLVANHVGNPALLIYNYTFVMFYIVSNCQHIFAEYQEWFFHI